MENKFMDSEHYAFSKLYVMACKDVTFYTIQGLIPPERVTKQQEEALTLLRNILDNKGIKMPLPKYPKMLMKNQFPKKWKSVCKQHKILNDHVKDFDTKA